MCGIYGIFKSEGPVNSCERVWAGEARRLLKHRGPDGDSCLDRLNGSCLLGHTRLAIIDVEGGAQPLSNEDETVWVVCNGEIYNYVELREELIARGHSFKTHSDCEVLAHLYEEKGESLVDELVGMYAFAILDERERKVVLARDRFGEKPLYWTPLSDGGGIAFASELKALRHLPGLDQQLDMAGLAQFLALGYVPAPRTHLRGIKKLQAGEILCAEKNRGISQRVYWRLQLPRPMEVIRASKEEARREVQRRLQESVRLRLRSDVPVGVFLSGGIDSTYVACVTRDLLPGSAFHTFCASFDDDVLNEAPYARMVAERIGSQHHEVHVGSDELLTHFDALIDHYDEPFADVSMFPTYAVCKAASLQCKVMLSGDGGDECFAGYREFFLYYRWNFLRRFPGVNALAQTARQWKKGGRGSGLLGFLSKSEWQLLFPAEKWTGVLKCFSPEAIGEAKVGIQELEAEAATHARLEFPRSAIEAVATRYLPEQILVKVDRASMYSALECRSPFLDQSLVEYVAKLPQSYSFARGQGKALLRESLPSWIPAEIRWRRKQGFTPPLFNWLRTSLRERAREALEEFPATIKYVIDNKVPLRLFDEQQAGVNRSDELFRWIVLAKRCRDGR